jgi:hypothetical protein
MTTASQLIAITQAAFEAIAATLPLGSVGYEAEVGADGERLIWPAPNVVDRLRALRGPGESYSDVILRLAKAASSATVKTRSRDAPVTATQCTTAMR